MSKSVMGIIGSNMLSFSRQIPTGSKFIYLFWVLCRFQHYTGHIMMGSFVGRGNQYTQLVKVLYCKLPTIGKQLPTFATKGPGLNR